jgi:HK97 family phage major capsid protein
MVLMNLLKKRPLEIRSFPTLFEQRNNVLDSMDALVKQAKTEKRAMSEEENTQFDKLKAQVDTIDKQISDDDKSKSKIEMRMVKKPSSNEYEIRGYKKEERIGQGSCNVTIGDLIYSHVTGRYRNQEVRDSLSTTSGGLVIPTEVYSDFIDMLRNQSFLGECTTYPMSSQTLLIPRVTNDPVPAFKLENDPIVESDPAFTSTTLRAKPLYCMTSVSLELIESSNLNVGDVITKIIRNAMVSAMQRYMLAGAVNGYTGILTDPNINTITATAVDYASIGAGVQAVMAANGQANGLILSADNMIALELATDTTGQFIAPPQFFQNLNKFTGTDLGNDALVGDLSSIAWGILSDGGLQVEVDRYGTAFQNGQIKIRARFNGDFGLTNPKLLSYISVA